MQYLDLKPISNVLRKCIPCNLLIFGLPPEILLWKSLNYNGIIVFINENRYYATYMEEKHHEIDAYDVQYTTKCSEMTSHVFLHDFSGEVEKVCGNEFLYKEKLVHG